MKPIRVVKTKRKDGFDHQRYKILIGDYEVDNCKEVSVKVSADYMITEVTFKVVATDFKWIDEEDIAGLSGNSPT